MKRIGVIGIGNPLRRDDGIGIALLEKLVKERDNLPDYIEYVDGGTGGMMLLHILARFEMVIIVDAVDFDGFPGESKLFRPDDINSKKEPTAVSTHEADFLKIIELSKKLNKSPDEIFIFGVQPGDMSFGMNLSSDLQQKVESLFVSLKKEITSILNREERHF